MKCQLVTQGYIIGDFQTHTRGGKSGRACEVALRKDGSGTWHRVISSAHLSRPEHYFSIYMSGCNLNCRKCHSHEFTKNIKGEWMSTEEIADLCTLYEKMSLYLNRLKDHSIILLLISAGAAEVV